MSPKARRVLVVTLLFAGTIVLVVGGAAVWILGTESGSRFAFERLGSFLEGSLEVESLHGPLRGPLIVEGLVYRTSGLTVTIRRAELRWRLSRLIRKQLDITSLTASGVRVTSTPTEDRKASEALPDVHLPVNVVVRSAEITDLTIGPGSPDPFVVDRISLATRSIGELVRIERLAVRSPRIDADASGTVRPQGEYPVDLEIRWNAPLRGETWRGRGTLSGSLDRLVVRHNLAQPFSAHLAATLTKPLRDLGFDGSVETEGVELAKLDPSLPAARISGSVHASGSIERFLATGSVAARLEGGPVGAAGASFRLERRADVWTIERARVEVPGQPDRLSVSGNVVAAEPVRLDLTAEWSSVSWPISGTPVVRSPRGRLRLAGSLADYGLEASADFVSSKAGSGRASLEGRGSGEALTLTRLEADVAGGSVDSAGRIAWKPAVAWDLTLEARGIDPASVSAKWPGAIDLVARTSGRRTESGLRGRLDVTRIGGNLRGFPVSGEATVVAAEESYEIERLAVSVGSGRLTASGTAGRRLDVRFEAAAGDLGDLLPEAGGSLDVHGTVRGTSEAPRIEAAIDGRALLWKGVTVSRLEGSGLADFRPGGPIRAELDARKLQARGRSFHLVSLRVRGTREAHEVAAALSGDRLKLVLAARGGLSNRTWSGALSKLDLDSREIGRWTLAQPARLSTGPTGGRIEGFCWTSSDGRLCADAGWNERRATIAGTASNLPLDLLEPLVPASVDLSGRLDGKVDLERLSDGRLEADARLATSATSVSWANEKGVRVERRIEKASLEGRAGSEGARATLALRLGGGGSLDGFVELPRYGDRSLAVRAQPLRARLQADLADVGFLQAFLPGIDRLAGSFAADVTVGGTPAAPTFSGRAALEGGRARLQRLGITVTGARVTASGRGGGPLAIEGRLESGGGTVTVTGTVAPGADRGLKLAIRGRRFEAMSTPEAHVFVSPDVELAVTSARASITGEVRVPEAEIHYRRTFAPISSSPDVVYVGRSRPPSEKEGAATPRSISARIRVVLGDKVIFRSLGLETRLEGSLLVVQSPGNEPQATGELRLAEGSYRKYGQKLTIERGRLVFAGPLDEPYVSVRAFRRADDGTVAGIELEGPLKSPRTSLFSEPQMREADQLAYILLGHPLAEANESEGNLVTSAATSLGIGGGSLLAKRLGSKVGLDVAKVETEGSFEEAALVLGKYLTPRLYLQYGVGLFDAVSTLRVEYILSKKWTVRAEVGEGTSADVLYTIER